MQCSRVMRCAGVILALSCSATASAADLAQTRQLEAAWRDADDLDGTLVELMLADGRAVAIHREARQATSRGGLILLHGRGTNANSLEILRPLRIGLSEAGWNTLSVQLPTVYTAAGEDDWLTNSDAIEARLAAGLAWLKQRGLRTIVVVGVGDSGLVALRAGASRRPDEIAAVALISSRATLDTDADRDALEKLTRPVLDLYAEHDLAQVTANAAQRLAAVRTAGLVDFRQRNVPGATAGYAGLDAALVATLRAWLNGHLAGTLNGTAR